MAKSMKAKTTTPFEMLLSGGAVKGSRLGKEGGLAPFPHLLDEGWVTEAAPDEMGKHFGGVDPEAKLMLAPQDESLQSRITKAHEMGHVLLSPPKRLGQLSDETGIPPNVLNAFEDGRVNGILRKESGAYADLIKGRGLPIDVDALEATVVEAQRLRRAQEVQLAKYRKAGQDHMDQMKRKYLGRARDHRTTAKTAEEDQVASLISTAEYYEQKAAALTVDGATRRRIEMYERSLEAGLSDEEIRMVGACVMAASEVYTNTPAKEAEWRRIAKVCGLDDEQIERVADLCHGLKDLTFEEMVAEIEGLADYLLDGQAESQQPQGDGAGEGGEGDGDETEAEAKPGDTKGNVESNDKSGMGSADNDGIDHKPENSGSDLEIEDHGSGPVTRVSVMKAPAGVPTRKPMTPAARQMKLSRVGSPLATFDASRTAARNTRTLGSLTYNPSRSEPMTSRGAFNSGVVNMVGTTRKHEEAKKEDGEKFGGDSAILRPDYGVEIATERGMLGPWGHATGVPDSDKFVKGVMTHKEYPLDEVIAPPQGVQKKARKSDRVGYLVTPFRAHVDGRIMRRKQKSRRQEPAGSLLLDLSGSMHPSSELIRKCLEIAPYAVIGGYGGRHEGKGSFAILAQHGRCVSQQTLSNIILAFGGGNEVDLLGIEWLAMQPKPRIWVSDAGICGTDPRNHSILGHHMGVDIDPHIHTEALNIQKCFQTCREYEIRRVLSIEMLVGMAPLRDNRGYA